MTKSPEFEQIVKWLTEDWRNPAIVILCVLLIALLIVAFRRR